MRQPGLDVEQIFKATRLQVNKVSTGAQTPWSTSTLAVGLKLFDAPGDGTPAPQAAAPAPPPAAAPAEPAPPTPAGTQVPVAEVPPPPPVAIPPVGRTLASRDELRQ